MTTQMRPVKPTLALLKNVAACLALVETLKARGPHLPGIGVFYGPSGFGKTYAAIYAQNKTGAYRVEVGDSWTRKTLLDNILAELGIEMRGTIADKSQAAIMALGDDPDRPLIIDEADKLVDKKMIEIVRELHEMSQAPVVLIGEERLPGKLIQSERTHNRVLEWTPAQPCDAEDTDALAALFCGGLTVAPDLLDEIRRQSGGRARRIVVNLNRVVEFARNAGLDTVGAQDFGATFYTGTPPIRSRRAA